MSGMTIGKDKVVLFHYRLTNDEGEVVDSSMGSDPLPYLHGRGNIVPGLEAALEGRAAGEKFRVDVPPELGYGEHKEELVSVFERSEFTGVKELEIGMRFEAQGEEGESELLTVTAIDEDRITVDGNHDFAGETLHFEVDVVEVRDASEEELNRAHLQPGRH
jgi:FKBP-type peptidyl-prolyl cis-trans isomerase SlyD